MEQDAKSRGGRPWSFDRERAIEIAMRLFWRHGYEGVSVGDLTKAIGIAPPSLYAAFGSKAGLYQDALARYEALFGSLDVAAIDAATTPADAVRRLLEAAVRAVTHPDREPGCMISSGMIACHPEHAILARDVAARRDAMRERIARMLRPCAGADAVRPLARHLVAVMQGISIQARDGATPAELQEIIEDVVSGVAARFPPSPPPTAATGASARPA
ncbi:TetR/AcrR family transcriptional regulator [Rhodovastum atsumiense]|uniref:TetR/AcrR family transcriptional regulator n=1 Tax=Rhodovastum atsumiense TaxID=504468 RepID=A0A5M6IME3_9PROT|nr:TetR/AcrR family transcriptional regulator [Rhodovastum atsumiense]KAA5609412.1 TetR/AcrR family transcriptional regulator [Rhodovastum atsumiense]CAH2601829.1 TetR/AcrR family transcriptional regulator [Rhodovastum atsumiense]